MSFREAQHAVDQWVGQFEAGYFTPLANVARLAEEVGELAREINHQFGPKPKKPDEQAGSMPQAPISRRPGVSTTYPTPATGTSSAAVVVCLPVRHFSLIAPTRSLSPGSRALSRLDFPAPDAPVKTECRPRSKSRSAGRPSSAFTDVPSS